MFFIPGMQKKGARNEVFPENAQLFKSDRLFSTMEILYLE